MMRKALLLAVVVGLPLAACQPERQAAAPPPPVALTADAIGHYCGMNLPDHPGPKGQVILKDRDRPIWLSSVRDTFAYTMLPEEAKDYRAIYVTDMGKAPTPAAPDLTAWVEARAAWYVLGSGRKGGMGQAEPFPFASETAARAFAAAEGGTVKRFTEVTEDEILTPPLPMAEGIGEGSENHDGAFGYGPTGAP